MENLPQTGPALTDLVKRAGTADIAPDLSRLDRFNPGIRAAVKALVGRSPRMAELAETFPGLLFKLAGPYPAGERQAICRLIESGAPLRKVAQALDMPFWLRRLAPEAYIEPLDGIPRSAAFERAVVNAVPAHPGAQTLWLTYLLMAARLVDEEFALWTAQNAGLRPTREKQIRWVWLMAYAWFSRHPETPACQLLERPFAKSMSLGRAHGEIEGWLNRIHLTVALGNAALGDAPIEHWCRRGFSRGYEIVPLTSTRDFLDESMAMRNCLDRYGPALTQGRLRVFSMRKAKKPVADFELVPHEHDPAIPTIRQLRSAGNARAQAEQWQAALAWLGRQKFPVLPAGTCCFAPRSQRDRHKSCKALLSPFLDSLDTPRMRRFVEEALVLARLQVLRSP